MADINPIMYSRELQKQLFPDNEFYKKSITETGIAIDVTSIQIPQAGDIGAVATGEPSSTPLTAVKRTDDIKSYDVQQLYMEDPILVTDENEIVTTYNKRSDIQTAQAMALNTKAGDIAANAWGATLASNIIRTSSTEERATEIVGATGNRLRLAYADLVAMQGIMNRSNAPVGNWYGLLTPAMADDLFLLDKLTDADKAQVALIKTGKIGMIFGVNFMLRYNPLLGTNGLSYDDSATPVKKAVGAAGAADDNGAALIWHERLVRHAEGHAKTYIDRDNPLYLGTILNSKVRFGATYSRGDEVGVISIVESAAPVV